MSDDLTERTMSDAPSWYGPCTADGWAKGWNACLAHEVSPGVTLGDAVRAYLALERNAVFDPASEAIWYLDAYEGRAYEPLAAAILAAAEVPDE